MEIVTYGSAILLKFNYNKNNKQTLIFDESEVDIDEKNDIDFTWLPYGLFDEFMHK